jgi:DNA polymerase-3 subunit beta
MKAVITRTVLLAALSRVFRVIETHDDIPVLNNTLLRTGITFLSFTGTDRCIEVTVEAPADVQAQGALTVPARPFYEVVRRLPEGVQVLLEAKGKMLTIRAGRSRFLLQTLPADSFPVFEKLPSIYAADMLHKDGPVAFTVDAADLGALFEQAQLAAVDDVRMYLTGVYFHSVGPHMLRAVATDGHKMVQRDVAAKDCSNVPGVIVPRKTAAEVCRLASDIGGTITVAVSKTRISFSAGGVSLTSKLIDGKFPDYGRVIPLGNDKTIEADRLSLENAIGRVAVIAGERGHAIKMEIEEGMLRLLINDAMTGSAASEELDVEYSGEPVSIAFNPRYFLEILARIGGDIVSIRLADEKTQMLIVGTDDDRALFVLSPMTVAQ